MLKVSIIMPSFNKAKYISEAINSVISQTYTNWELIIVDDYSNDDSQELINSFASKFDNIKTHFNPENKGANYCRNFGIENAKGSYIVFLDADDLLAIHCIEDRMNVMNKNNTLDFCVFTMGVFNKKIGDSDLEWKPTSKSPLTDFLFHQLPWAIPQPIWKTDFIRSIDGFNQDFVRMQDVELHTRALLIENVLYKQIVAKPDCYYRIDEDRKILNTFNFISLRIDSTILYVQRFKFLPMKQRKYLIGTIYETFLQLVYVLKKQQITKVEFEILKKKLFNQSINLTKIQKILFNCSQLYNFNLFRLMGVNRIFKYLILFNTSF
jgi:glycosyltransferase involved in cell wall biosynthesis